MKSVLRIGFQYLCRKSIKLYSIVCISFFMMANGETNHPEPLERHGSSEEEGENNDENEAENMSTSEQDELLEDAAEQEYAALEKTLDQIDSCLDQLDQKNDDLNAKLRALLATSRQDYEELTAARNGTGDAGSGGGQKDGQTS